MRASEFAAEVVILLSEGPQDKKDSIELYYQEYVDEFASADEIRERFLRYVKWIQDALPDLPVSRWRKPVDFYSLLGALDDITDQGELLDAFDPMECGRRLTKFEQELKGDSPSRTAARYLVAAGSQTDNIQPRSTRIDILRGLLGEFA